MEPIVLAAGTALVGAMATDAWEQVREAIAGLWRRSHGQRAENVETGLDKLREQVLRARHNDDADAEKALEGAWQLKLQRLLEADPCLADGLQQVLDHVLTPVLSSAGQARVGKIIMTGSSHDSSTFTQIGSQTNYDRP